MEKVPLLLRYNFSHFDTSKSRINFQLSTSLIRGINLPCQEVYRIDFSLYLCDFVSKRPARKPSRSLQPKVYDFVSESV